MFSETISIPKLKVGFGRPPSIRKRHSGAISRWVPRRPVLGIEVNGGSLSLFCIKFRLGQVPLTYFDSIPDFAVLSPQDLGRKLQEFLQPLSGEDTVIALGLPRREVMVRFLELPVGAKKSFAEAVALQVEMYKPTDTEPFDWDTTVLEQSERLAATLLFAPHSTVEKFSSLFLQAGYPITRLMVTQFSMLHELFQTSLESGTERCVLLDYKEVDAELALLEGNRLLYSRSFPLTGEGSAAVPDVLAQIQQAFSSLRWRESDSRRIFLAGEVPESLACALASFGSVAGLPEKLGLPGFPSLSDLRKYSGAAAVALSALGLRRRPYCLNLLPAALQPTRSRLRHLPTYALLTANAALLLAIGFRVPVQDYVLLREYRKEIAGVQMHASEMKQLLQSGREIRKELQALDDFQRRGRLPLDALNEIAQKLPSDAWVNAFSCKKGQVDLSGSAKTASPLLALFQTSSQFQDVKFNGALSQESSGAERFRLHMRLKEKP